MISATTCCGFDKNFPISNALSPKWGKLGNLEIKVPVGIQYTYILYLNNALKNRQRFHVGQLFTYRVGILPIKLRGPNIVIHNNIKLFPSYFLNGTVC